MKNIEKKIMKTLILATCCLSWINLSNSQESINATYEVIYEDVTTRNIYQEQTCSRNRRCENPLMYCNRALRKCICREIYEMNEIGECICSKENGDACKACCEDNSCYNGYCTYCYEEDERNFVCQTPKMSFITASQIALCAAMLLGIIALSTLLWRICTKPEYLGRRNRPDQTGSTTNDGVNRSLSRISLSSVQIRILSRLRDRPPRYETNNNYEHQQNEAVPQIIPLTIPLGEAPPSYDGSRNSISDRPPPYTVIVTSGQGISNEGFVVEDEALKITTGPAQTISDKEVHI